MSEDLTVRGITLPKGLNVTIQPWMLHHNPRVWPDVERFDPERWFASFCLISLAHSEVTRTAENSQGRDPYAFVPFSAGPRNCIGQKFAMEEMKVLLCKLLRHFDIASTIDDIPPVPEIILRPADGVPVILTKRNR